MLDVTAEGLCCSRRRCRCCRDSGSDLDSADEEAMFQRWAPLSPSDWSWPEGGRVFSPSPFVSSAGCFVFFFPRLVCATQKQPLRKEGKKRKEKKKEEKLVFLAGCELFPPHYFPKNRSEHESFNNKYVAVFVCFGTKKTFFWSSPKVFFHVWILRKAAILHAFAPLDPDASDSFHLQHQNMCILIFFNSAATKINLFFINTRAVCLLNVRKVQDELLHTSFIQSNV